ncbi:hypothetical protein SAMN04489712_10134 [Thermomonospora echinospora]|uniref:Excreted virulence factor EspC, type VII ESX diderm n=1 Tax=Thermomonospora echinospora TaxID=1992 RepID=A0A1H5S0U8_9ACTN|nr:DUF6507 family protein [Thermomonospora echinospora]SEF44209.1 hypothetical protein SAMN04489712_10134 [Thermomonospora echinospora]
MTGWNIAPGEVANVVTTVGGYIGDADGGDGLVGQIEDFARHVEDAAMAASSMPIGTALKEYVTHTSPGLKGMVTKTASCVTGAVQATKAYINGDLEMAAEAQRNAVDAPAPRIGG